MKLNERQFAALVDIAAAPGKSGKFYADLGHKATTLSSLYSRHLLRTGRENIIGRSIYGAQWRLTPEGEDALTEARP